MISVFLFLLGVVSLFVVGGAARLYDEYHAAGNVPGMRSAGRIWAVAAGVVVFSLYMAGYYARW